MNTTHVRNAQTGMYELRPWKLPLIVAVCPAPDCPFHAIAVSIEAADVGLWAHTAALHLGGYDAG